MSETIPWTFPAAIIIISASLSIIGLIVATVQIIIKKFKKQK
tara:strand:- start:5732 stop:5857 length:126 start_codon:yes stop_codon:yes gene_type:complete